MQGKTEQHWIKEQLRKFIMGFQLISSLALGVFVAAVLYFALQYIDAPAYTNEQVLDAQKIGNWKFPDDKYVLKNIENISIGSKNFNSVTIKDKQSGNTFIIFDISFSQNEILKMKDNIQNRLLEKYGLEGSFLKSSGNRTGKFGEEFIYSEVGWSSGDSAKTGIIGSLDCVKNKQSGDYIIAFAFNGSVKYSALRALSFINTLNCPLGGYNAADDENIGDKIDTDSDGLTDKVEKMLLSDPYNKDTDDDGHNDFEELQTGYSPMIPRSWDKYTLEDFAKVKKDIKYISADVYNKLFPGEQAPAVIN